ncbi:MAG: DnaA regulatory inactivator Hda [Betaproteobacteria bacterium]
MKQIALPIGVTGPRTFDTFVTGANAAAVQALRALAPFASPVYLWGPAGAGKTHLLEAAAQEAQRGGERVGRFDAATPLPWHADGAALVVLDDCDALDAACQHAAFALFVDAATSGTPIAAAGRLPPVDLPLREDLRTRLGWGHVYALFPLVEAEMRAALRREAERRGLVLGDEVLDYLLTRFPRDLKHQHELLDALDAYAWRAKRAPTLPLLRQMLADDDA